MSRENHRSFPGRKAEKINSEWNSGANINKPSSLLLAEKLNLPIIKPTVIQALPTVQRTLPSLQSIQKRSTPNSPTKNRKVVPKPTSTGRRILPSLPRIEDLTLPRIQQSAMKKDKCSPLTAILQTSLEEQSLRSAQMSEAKVGTRTKRVRRVLPSIPPTETRTPRMQPTKIRDQSSIQPTVVRPLTKFRGARRKPMLPSLPTIEEQTSPTPVEETTPLASVDRSDQNSALAENKASLALKEGETFSGSQQKRESSLRQGEKDKTLSRKKDQQDIQPRKKEPQKKPKRAVEETQTNIQSVDKEARPGLKPIDKGKDMAQERRRRKENRASHPWVKPTPASPDTEAEEKCSHLRPTKYQQVQVSESVVEEAVSRPTSRSKDRPDCLREDVLLSSVKQCRESCHSKTKEESVSHKAMHRDTEVRAQEAKNQKLSIATAKGTKGCHKMTEKGALPCLQGTVELIKNSRQSREKEVFPCLRKREGLSESEHALDQKAPWPSSAKGNNANDQCSEREGTKKPKQREKENKVSRIGTKLSWVDSYALLSRKWKESSSQLHNSKRRENEDKRSCRPIVNRSDKKQLSAGSYAMLNLQRKEFEALTPSLELIAGRNQTRTKASAKGGNDRQILTVKPALPSIEPTHESTVEVPHPPTVPKIKQGLPSARPIVKRVNTGIQATMTRLLPHIQPIVKQALPGLHSSSLQELVKKPLPSVQPQEDFCSPGAVQATAKSDSQILTTETERNTEAEQQ